MINLLRNRWMFIALSFITPLWFVFGRIPFGVIGWLTLILLLALPVTILLLLGLSLWYFFRKDIRTTGLVPVQAARVLWLAHGALFLASLFFVDFGDVEESVNSVFTRLVGRNSLTLLLSFGAEILLMGVFVAALIWAVVLRVAPRKSLESDRVIDIAE